MKGINIELTPLQRALAWSFAWKQTRESQSHTNKKVSSASDAEVHFIGYCGEFALRLHLGLPLEYTGGTYGAGDLPGIEVRTRTSARYDLKVKPDEEDSLSCVLAIWNKEKSTVSLLGWISAREGKTFATIDPHDKGQPFHAVPAGDLKPMETLPWKVVEKTI